jgi:hypothetical protein
MPLFGIGRAAGTHANIRMRVFEGELLKRSAVVLVHVAQGLGGLCLTGNDRLSQRRSRDSGKPRAKPYKR